VPRSIPMQGPVGVGGGVLSEDAPPRRVVIVDRRGMMFCLPSDAAIDDPRDREEEKVPTPNIDAETTFNDDTTTTTSTDSIAILVVSRTFRRSLRWFWCCSHRLLRPIMMRLLLLVLLLMVG